MSSKTVFTCNGKSCKEEVVAQSAFNSRIPSGWAQLTTNKYSSLNLCDKCLSKVFDESMVK